MNIDAISQLTVPVNCSCGHMGAITRATSKLADTKYWETYTIHYLDCRKEIFTRKKTSFMQIFQKLKPACPRCYKSISLEYLSYAFE